MSAGGEYGKLYKSAWGDRDFKALTEGEQALYQKLISQSDTSLAGVLTYAPVRWAGQTAGMTVADIESRMAGLVEKRYALVDLDTQEVLIRSYIRNDSGWRSPRTMLGVAGAVRRILSPLLRAAVSVELQRIDTSDLSDSISEKTNRSTRQVVDGAISDLLLDTPADEQAVDTLSIGYLAQVRPESADTVSIGYPPFVHATATAQATAIATATAPISCSSADAESESDEMSAELIPLEAPRPTPRNSADEDFAAWWALYPRKVGKGQAAKAYRAARKKATPEALFAAVTAQAPLLMARGSQYCPHPATWLNGERWRDEPTELRSTDPKRYTRADWEHLANRAAERSLP